MVKNKRVYELKEYIDTRMNASEQKNQPSDYNAVAIIPEIDNPQLNAGASVLQKGRIYDNL